MAKTPRQLTKRSKVLGVPVGPRRTDWRKIGVLGLGAASTVAGGLRARQAGQQVVQKVKEPIEKGKEAVASVTDQVGSIGSSMAGASTPLGKVTAAVKSVGGGDSGDGGGSGDGGRNLTKLRLIIKEHIDVGVPRKVAYNQWTQFEDLASILKGVANVSQQKDDQTRWSAKIGPSRRQWTAEIKEQNPDERIVWETTEGAEHRGAITFHSLDHNLTRVQVEMEYFPRGFIEKFGNIFLVARRRVRKDLRLFKHYLELAGKETGAWRGEISKQDDDEQQSEGPESNGQESQGQESQGQEAQDDSPRGGPEGNGHGDGAQHGDGQQREHQDSHA